MTSTSKPVVITGLTVFIAGVLITATGNLAYLGILALIVGMTVTITGIAVANMRDRGTERHNASNEPR